MNNNIIVGTMNIHEGGDGKTATQQTIVLPARWPDWKAEKLRELWIRGMTGGQIAQALGITRNAVVGKRHRMGLTARQRQQRPRQTDQQRRSKRNARLRENRRLHNVNNPRKPPVPPVDIYMIDSKQIPSLGVPLAGLTWSGPQPSNCRAIVSPDGAKETLYCGLPNWGFESYCAGHCKRFLNKFNPGNISGSGVHFRVNPAL